MERVRREIEGVKNILLDGTSAHNQLRVYNDAVGRGDSEAAALNEVVDWLISHRLKREAKVVEKLEAHPGLALFDLTKHVYDEVDPKLHRLASRSLLAHLLKLEADGRAECIDDLWSLTRP